MKPLIVSPAPHAHSGDSVRRNMLLVIIALLPAFAVSVCSFGWSTVITTAISIAACILTEWVISKFVLKIKPTLCDCSAILTGLLLAFNLPANLPWWIVIIGAIVAIGVGKMTFGGLGQNPFNPALVGRVFLLISFPVQMTTWPCPLSFETQYVDTVTGATPLSALKVAIKGHDGSVLNQLPELWDMFIGYTGGSLGEICAFALIIGGLLLIITRVITWHIPVSIIATVALFAWISTPEGMCGHEYALCSLLSGGLMLGAFFMATDYVTSPMTGWGKIIFGIGIGLITMVIRTWGAYPEGVSFAILIMNATVPLLNKIRPKRFGEAKA
ncbi:MAG: RnfABCDGE type electron transport complex subunit D [Paludibacteraceae bacterium]|nr:RnfABCDGE type electron transport complex subunit D [Paludibacteraceae bacterium]